MQQPAQPAQWRRTAALIAAAVVVAWAGWIGWRNHAAFAPPGNDAERLNQQIARFAVARNSLPADMEYRLLLVPTPKELGAYAAVKGQTEYAFAPVVVDVESKSPLIVVVAQDEQTLDAWLVGREPLLVQRFEGAVALLQETPP